jgi:hypothetical protein
VRREGGWVHCVRAAAVVRPRRGVALRARASSHSIADYRLRRPMRSLASAGPTMTQEKATGKGAVKVRKVTPSVCGLQIWHDSPRGAALAVRATHQVSRGYFGTSATAVSAALGGAAGSGRIGWCDRLRALTSSTLQAPKRCAHGVPVQMWQGQAQSLRRCGRQSWCRCGRREPGRGADVIGASPVAVQMWQRRATALCGCARQAMRSQIENCSATARAPSLLCSIVVSVSSIAVIRTQ